MFLWDPRSLSLSLCPCNQLCFNINNKSMHRWLLEGHTHTHTGVWHMRLTVMDKKSSERKSISSSCYRQPYSSLLLVRFAEASITLLLPKLKDFNKLKEFNFVTSWGNVLHGQAPFTLHLDNVQFNWFILLFVINIIFMSVLNKQTDKYYTVSTPDATVVMSRRNS